MRGGGGGGGVGGRGGGRERVGELTHLKSQPCSLPWVQEASNFISMKGYSSLVPSLVRLIASSHVGQAYHDETIIPAGSTGSTGYFDRLYNQNIL